MVIVIIMDDVYYHTFQDGPMGIGLEPEPGKSVGSVVSVVLESSQEHTILVLFEISDSRKNWKYGYNFHELGGCLK